MLPIRASCPPGSLLPSFSARAVLQPPFAELAACVQLLPLASQETLVQHTAQEAPCPTRHCKSFYCTLRLWSWIWQEPCRCSSPCRASVGQELLLSSHWAAAVARAGAALCPGHLFLLLVVFFLEAEAPRWLRGPALLRRLRTAARRRDRLSTEHFCSAACKCDGEMRFCLLLLQIVPATSMVSCVTRCSTAAR